MKTIIFKVLPIIVIVNVTVFFCEAQKLPKVQEKSLLLPTTVKADGRANEWDNKFEAFNNSTEIYYTIADNKDALYLAVQATDPLIIKKIISGGITFTICRTGQRNDPNPVNITFPIISPQLQSGITMSINELSEKKSRLNKDSIVLAVNNKILGAAKEIKMKGFNSNSDSLISIYNNLGLKAGIAIDINNTLTYELIIPLKLLKLSDKKENQIAYNIMLNGASTVKSVAVGTAVVTNVPRSLASNSSDYQTVQFATDFWGNYLLTINR